MTAMTFGSCCSELADALAVDNTFFRRADDGVWYLTVGYVNTPNGTGFFDSAVIHCPFCGMKLQDKLEIERKAKSQRD